MPKNPLARSATHAPANPDASGGELVQAVPRLVELAARELSVYELLFAEHFAQHNNATAAYAAAFPCEGWKRNVISQRAWEVSNRPHVLRYVRELLSAAAAVAVVDVARLLESDRRIVEAYELHADEITQHVLECCRYCHGRGHAYQWIDEMEYYAALEAADQRNEERIAHKQRPLALPTDEGGYGFSASNDPHIECPKCEGRGTPRVYFADTTKLSGGARLLVKGIKQGSQGQLEILMHDVDKAKERLLKAAGAFGDDAASVARGAAAGAAQGALAAQAIAKRVDDMSADDARKAYLTMAQL